VLSLEDYVKKRAHLYSADEWVDLKVVQEPWGQRASEDLDTGLKHGDSHCHIFIFPDLKTEIIRIFDGFLCCDFTDDGSSERSGTEGAILIAAEELNRSAWFSGCWWVNCQISSGQNRLLITR
jgi:hypothetical protein